MKVEKVPDSTYEMVGGLDKQVVESPLFIAAHTILPICRVQAMMARSSIHPFKCNDEPAFFLTKWCCAVKQ